MCGELTAAGTAPDSLLPKTNWGIITGFPINPVLNQYHE